MDIAAYILAFIGAIFLAFAGLHGFENKSVTIISFGAGAILFVVAGCLYWQDALWKREAGAKPKNQSTERPYVLFRMLRLKNPLTAGSTPVIEFQLENISTTSEVTVELKDITYYFTPDVVTDVLEYRTAPPVRTKMQPTEKYYGNMSFGNFVISDELLRGFNENKTQLFFFGKGKYTDQNGRSYPLPFCRKYDKDMIGNLILCDEAITFK